MWLSLEDTRRSLKHIHLGMERCREDEYGRCMMRMMERALEVFIAYFVKCSYFLLDESIRHIHCIGWVEFGG